MSLSASHDFWQLVDGVLVINLDDRPERWARVQAGVAGLVPTGKLHRVSAIRGRNLPGYGNRPWFHGRKRDATWAGRGGCALSHRKALATARERGWQTTLVLEDDALVLPAFSEVASPLQRWLRQMDADWDVCYLGFTDPWGPYRELASLGTTHRLIHVFGCATTHAYLVKPAARDWILARLPDENAIWPWLSRHRAVDRWYLRTLGQNLRVVAVSPEIITQNDGFSDVTQRNTDYATSRHRRVVPQAGSDASFRFKYALRSALTRVDVAYDGIRGRLKRWQGF